MNLTDKWLRELDTADLTDDQRAVLRCGVAADLIHRGQHEAARDALGELWRGVAERPNVEGLEETAAAEVLLQCGALSGWLGTSKRVEGAQEAAKDLIGEALRVFDAHGLNERAAEARYELGMCYWRSGALDEARVILQEALQRAGDASLELRAKILIRSTLVEVSAGRYHDALKILEEAEPVFKVASDAIKGRWHAQMGLVMRRLGAAEGRADYFDRAIIEITAAVYHFEQAGHERYCANNLNNLAPLLARLGRYGEAHEQLDRAQLIFTRLRDAGNLAQVDETRARVFIAERKYKEASRIIAGVIKALERGGEYALLADALTVQGVGWARLGSFESSIKALHRAVKVAQECGAESSAGVASLTLIEEHGEGRLSETELYEIYRRADALLKGTQDAEDIARLRVCARIVMRRMAGMPLHGRSFSLFSAVNELEARLIGQALEEAKGSVTGAAKLLGLRYQTLTTILNTRHKRLLKKRTPAKKRKQSIIKSSS
jgi:tetratricopeptide (TPR) repeat protein